MYDMPPLAKLGRLTVGLVLWFFASLLQAASLSVNPVLITLDSSDSIAAMTVTNRGANSVVMQASVNAWSIRDNEEHYEPTVGLIVTPPVFEIAPGKSQIVRVGLSDTAPKTIEQSFRVFLEQSPATPGDEGTTADDNVAKGPRAIQMMLRIGIPVFVKPVGAHKRELVWRAERLANGQLRIEVTNQGNRHSKISRLTLLDRGKVVASSEAQRYILPGSRRHWLFDVPAGTAAPYRIKAKTNEGVLDTTVTAFTP